MTDHGGAPDDGRLRPVRRRDALTRSLYFLDHPGPDGGPVRYTVEIDAENSDMCVVLYADGRRQEEAESPAAFPVTGGVIEVDLSLYGVRRVHLVLDDGRERRLTPVPGTLEEMRGQLHRRRPRLSRAIGWAAVVALVVNLVLAVPQGLEVLTRAPRIAELFGTFESPVMLPAWLNTALFLAGAAAAVERVLTLRSNRVIDFETLWVNL